MPETDLYAPVKRLLESQGYAVKSEVNGCDVVAIRGDAPPVVVELKSAFNLALLLQGVDRQAVTDHVYLAFAETAGAARRRSDILKLCRLLGLGVLLVRSGRGDDQAEPLLDPAPYRPRKAKARTQKLLREFHHRVGDPNTGGATRVKLLTAYRQDAIRCADALSRLENAAPRVLRAETGVERASAILRDNVYGWFDRVERGVYELSPAGREALVAYDDAAARLRADAGRLAA